MLTREHAIASYKEGRLHPDRLTRVTHALYPDLAARMLEVYRRGIGRTRGELHADLRTILADDPTCPPRRREAFCKLMDEERVSTWDTDRAGRATELRQRVFRAAARFHPLVAERDALFEYTETEAKQKLAAEMEQAWPDVEGELFADVIEFHRLREFRGYDQPGDLLARYNVAQVQVALFRATRLTIWARQDFKTILRYAKLARLLHRITREPDGYRIEFDGPDSVLRETHRYGVNMACFLPALLACQGWRLQALIRTNRGGWKVRLDLSPKDGLRSHLPEPEEFDSALEAAFAKRWGPSPREGWTMEREAELLHARQHVCVPDFTFRHADGRRVHLEIVGFWTPEYLKAKVESLALFPEAQLLLAVTAAAQETAWPVDESRIIRFKSALKLDAVLAALRVLP